MLRKRRTGRVQTADLGCYKPSGSATVPRTEQQITSEEVFRRTRPPRRRTLLVSVILLLLGVVTVGFLLYSLGGSRHRPELSDTQWQSLVEEFSRIAETDRLGAGAASSSEPPAPTTGESQDPTRPLRPTRAPRPTVDAPTLATQAEAYAADRPKSVIELQRFRHASAIEILGREGRRGRARLINLSPRINAWYLLEVDWEGEPRAAYHLGNSEPDRQTLRLDPTFASGVVIDDGVAPVRCDLWSVDATRSLTAAATQDSPYVLLCDGLVTLRMPTAGRKTTMERVTDFLRDNVWGGERITAFVRQTMFQDSHLESPETTAAQGVPGGGGAEAPGPARVDATADGKQVAATGLGLFLESSGRDHMVVGRWYRVQGNRGIWASAIQPGQVDREILASHTDRVSPLDEVERDALAYLVAFDLDRFELGFAMGTDHPRVGWSDRVAPELRPPGLPGPDGFDTLAPLVSTGIIPPALAPRTVATFTAGFKRSHGAFRHGVLATVNHGSHYGFVEHGVVLSKLQPGLSTLYVLDDGRVDMKTWTSDDDELLERIRFARQNGVPIVEYATGGTVVPGALVNRWGPGNWSGSQDGRYRTLRAGACLQETDARRFLIYGYFSTATPGAMARVFQAYGCHHAMLLDMNALEHTYLAVYFLRGSELGVQHLIGEMSVLDRSGDEGLLPRFLGYADNRDFFYLLRRDATSGSRREIEP